MIKLRILARVLLRGERQRSPRPWAIQFRMSNWGLRRLGRARGAGWAEAPVDGRFGVVQPARSTRSSRPTAAFLNAAEALLVLLEAMLEAG